MIFEHFYYAAFFCHIVGKCVNIQTILMNSFLNRHSDCKKGKKCLTPSPDKEWILPVEDFFKCLQIYFL